jgi:PIN domain nuclease of toxin-antitoxin system
VRCWRSAAAICPRRPAAALRAAPEAHVSTVSPWEVAIKVASRKLEIAEAPASWFLGLADRYQLREVPLDARIACAAAICHTSITIPSIA